MEQFMLAYITTIATQNSKESILYSIKFHSQKHHDIMLFTKILANEINESFWYEQ